MKRLLLLLSFIPLISFAQTPQGVGYQGVATDNNGVELVNQAISVRASVLSGSANGTIEWEETHATSTDTFGLFSLTIGQGASTGNGAQTSFADISWGSNTHFLKIEMDLIGGNNYTFMGTNQMMSVPYSLHSKTAANVDPTDELQSLSISGDTIFISDGNHLVIPGISGISTLLKYGCTDVLSCNYDPIANTDDSSCFPTDIVDMTAAPWSLISHLSCIDTTTTNAVQNMLFSANFSGTTTQESNGNIYTYQFSWVFCDTILYLEIPSWGVIGADALVAVYSNGSFTFSHPQWSWCGIISPCTAGCMDSTADNYNPSATCDYGYCCVYGCTDPTYCNYDSTATCDDGSCDYMYYIGGCTDPTACNYDSTALCEDGSCLTNYGCTDPLATNYDVSATCDDSSCVFALAIGDTYQGGIIFWLDGNGGGLIAAPTDQSTGAEWGCMGTNIPGADGTALATGNQNTIDIVNANCSPYYIGNSIAANICDALTLDGYNDWFLPSKDELNEMYLNIGQGNALGLGNIGGFASGTYWSSTESAFNGAWEHWFNDGYQNSSGKASIDYVRAIRAF